MCDSWACLIGPCRSTLCTHMYYVYIFTNIDVTDIHMHMHIHIHTCIYIYTHMLYAYVPHYSTRSTLRIYTHIYTYVDMYTCIQNYKYTYI